jgi:hypothetical protein
MNEQNDVTLPYIAKIRERVSSDFWLRFVEEATTGCHKRGRG